MVHYAISITSSSVFYGRSCSRQHVVDMNFKDCHVMSSCLILLILTPDSKQMKWQLKVLTFHDEGNVKR